MEALIAQSILALLEWAAVNAPSVVENVGKMFSKGVPTVEEIRAEKARVSAITLDDVQPPDDAA